MKPEIIVSLTIGETVAFTQTTVIDTLIRKAHRFTERGLTFEVEGFGRLGSDILCLMTVGYVPKA